MTTTKMSGVPDGLPARFDDPDSGFTRLCEFLEIANRAQQQSIINTEGVKRVLRSWKTDVQKLPTAKRRRLLLTVFYSFADERRALWKHIQNASGDMPIDVPSFEYHALRDYDAEFSTGDMDNERVVQALTEFPDAIESIADLPEWQRPALAIWPDLRRDVIEWDTLEADRQDAVALAVFAVATILDDSRYLHWATERVDVLVDEFAFLRAAEAKGSEQAPAAQEDSVTGVTETKETEADTVATTEEIPDGDMSGVIQQWRHRWTAIADCASTLGNELPPPERLRDLRQHVHALEQLHDPVVAFLDANRPEHLVASVANGVGSLADDQGAPWLRDTVDQIHAQWKLVYLAGGDISVEQLREDVARIERELHEAVIEWRGLQDECENLNAELREIRAQPRGDLASQLNAADHEAKLQASSAEATKRARGGLLSVLRVSAPNGHEFEPSRDYVQEWLDATPDTDSVPRTATPHITTPYEVKDTPERIGKAAGAEDVTKVDAGSQHDSGQEDVPAANVQVRLPGGVSNEASVKTLAGEDSTSSGSQFDNAIAALWQSVDERPGIAYHIARLLTDHDCHHPSLPPPDLIAAAMLANSAESADDAVVEELRPVLSRIAGLDLSREDVRLQDALNLMLFCATLRPALAQVTGAASLLRRVNISSGLAPVAKLAESVARHVERLEGVRIDGSLLKTASSNTAWEKEFAELSERVREWHEKARRQRILFVHANRIWTRWLQKDGCLGRLAELITTDGASAKNEVKQYLERFSDRKQLSALVKETDRGRVAGKISDVIGRALTQLQTHVQPARDLGAEWLRLMDVKPQAEGFVDRSIAELRHDLTRFIRPALRALDTFGIESLTPLRVAASQVGRSAHGLLWVLDDGGPDQTPDGDRVRATPDSILWRDLLYVTELDLNAEGRPANELSSTELVDLLANTDAHAQAMSVASDRRLRRGNLAGAHLACDEMVKAADPQFDRCRSELDKEIRRLKGTLIKNLALLREDTEQAFCFGQLSDQERNSIVERTVKLESALDGEEAIERVQVDVDKIKGSIESSRAKLIAQAQERFQVVAETCSDDARDRINKCIHDGYIIAANELISQVHNRGTIESVAAEREDPFLEFMTVLEKGEADATADALMPDTIVKAATARGRVAGVSFESLSQDEAAEAAHLLTTWYHLSTARRLDDSTDLGELLLSLGFRVRKSRKGEAGRGWSEVLVETDAIRERSICPLPQFGSEANGRYRLLLNWAQPVSELVSRNIGSGVSDPIIILHFGRLGRDRENLRRLAITKQRSFLVVDESLMWYLSARGTARLAALFRCTLPFSAVEPYLTTSGLVPPELFYGRTHDQRSIMDRHGSCFIYGGRQLGKTALLRTVERTFHNPKDRRLAKWVDLKVGGIGSAGRRADDIWSLLWHELHNLPVLPTTARKPSTGNQAHVDAMISEIEQWVNARDDSRFLLLLDEADGFLGADALTDFRESTRLKGLMDRTDRRFKVVLAGLHNVLRATERSNHPLAHFGEPICVGPLLTNGEWEQAHELVRGPLASVGCNFERDALGTRILAYTNYYPSLIQLYGAELVRQLRDSTKPFPYVVTSEDVDAAYRDTGLRNAIRERFLWTLQLDLRYEVVAYALAHELLEHGSDIDNGVERSRIAIFAKYWWPLGFDKTTDAQFNVLLDEMVGLGVLRSIEGGKCYTLRNPNILLLLGNIDDIEQALLKEREVGDNFDPTTFRPQYKPPKSSPKYAPLTHEQVGQLMGGGGVTVVAGTRNGNVHFVPEYLAVRGSELFKKLRLTREIDDFERALGEFQPQSSDVTNVVFVPQETPWTGEWLKAARRVLRRKKRGAWIRLVLLADPETLWRVVGEPDSLVRLGNEWCAVGPWQDDGFLGRWLDDNQLPSDPGNRRELLDVTGGWPILLERFNRRRRNSEWKMRIEGMQHELAKPSEQDKLLGDFGVSTTEVEQEMGTLCDFASEYGEETVKDIADAAGTDVDSVRRRMEWSERLGLVARTGDGWVFNPLVKRLLARR